MNLEALLSDRLAPALHAVAGHPVDPVIRRSPHADFQSGAALALARTLGRSPRDIAAGVIAAADLDGVATAAVSGPGFINLTADDSLIAGGFSLVPPAVRPERVVVDYSGPNVAKEMHVGHLRSTIIGDAAVRVLTWLEHDVVRVNHVGDWGTPFGMLIEHMLDTGGTGTDGLADLTAFYQAARAKFDTDDDFRIRARNRVVALQSGDEPTRALWRRLVGVSEAYFLEIYDRLDIALTRDDFAGESFYNDRLPAVVDDLAALGLLRESDGALCAFPDGFTGRDGEPLPLIVRKSDGGYSYAATDLAAVRYRVDELGADRLLYVIGEPQRIHVQMVFAVAREAGWLPDKVTASHIAFGSVLGADGKMLKTRAGSTVKLAALIDEAVTRASALNPAIAAEIGVGAIKWADLSSDRMSGYTLDFDRMLALTGNTGPYVQYAYARIQSILSSQNEPGPVVLGEPAERALALELLAVEPVIAAVGENLEFHRLCGQLYAVAAAFSTFYEKCPVLTAPLPVQASRLTLCRRTADTLRLGLGLLGIRTPDRM
jgi:arginyl-tRNA synthetase